MAVTNLINFQLIQGVPVISAQHEQIKLNFIIDTGASNCVLCNSIVDKLDYRDSQHYYRVYGIDGSSIEAGTIKTDIQIGDCMFQDLIFQTVDIPGIDRINKKYNDGFELHGLLGSNFLNHFHLILNYSKSVLQIEEN